MGRQKFLASPPPPQNLIFRTPPSIWLLGLPLPKLGYLGVSSITPTWKPSYNKTENISRKYLFDPPPKQNYLYPPPLEFNFGDAPLPLEFNFFADPPPPPHSFLNGIALRDLFAWRSPTAAHLMIETVTLLTLYQLISTLEVKSPEKYM